MDRITKLSENSGELPESIHYINERFSRSVSRNNNLESSDCEFSDDNSTDDYCVLTMDPLPKNLLEDVASGNDENGVTGVTRDDVAATSDGGNVTEGGQKRGPTLVLDEKNETPSNIVSCAYVHQNSVNEEQEKVERKNLIADSTSPIIDLVGKEKFKFSKYVTGVKDFDEADSADFALPHAPKESCDVVLDVEGSGKVLASAASSRDSMMTSSSSDVGRDLTWKKVILIVIASVFIALLVSTAIFIPIYLAKPNNQPERVHPVSLISYTRNKN